MATSFCFKIGFVHNKGEEGDTWKQMAQKERVMPNCVYACNPYHECTEFCLQKSKETKPTKTKKGADYRRSVTDNDLGKKVNGEKHTHTGCPKASNPYHVCNEHCNKRMSGADSGTLSLGRRKKPGPKPELPILDSVPASKIGAIYLSDASSPLSKYSEVKKVEPKQSEIIPVSGEIHIQGIKLVNRKVLPNKDDAEYVAANPIGIKHEGDKNSSTKVVPIPNVYGTGGFITSAVGSMDFNSSDISNDNDESDGEETGSMVSESRVPIGSYHVKESFVPILMSIFNKHGDIGASCHLESVVMRSYYIECVCFVVQELQSTSILHLTKSNVKELLAILKDVESAQLNVAWLRSILDGIAENIDFINQYRAAEVAKANYDQEIEQLRKVLDSELGSLVQKEQEVTDTKTRIEEIKERLDQLALKTSDLDKNLLSTKSKVDDLDSKSILHELF